MSPEAFLDEAKIMKQCRHDKLVRLYAACSQEEPIYIVREFMSKGSLLSYMRKGQRRNISLVVMVDMAAQIASGMDYMEQRKLIHRNLAARNILVGENNIVKVADLGGAKVIEDDEYNPEQGMANREVLKSVDGGYRIPKPSDSPDSMYEMMLKCWDKRAKNRATFEFLFGFFDDFERDYAEPDFLFENYHSKTRQKNM